MAPGGLNAKVPPNGNKNQQFKDSAVWQAVLALSLRYSTVLLTNDKAFFRNRNPKEGLAENLVEDCSKAGTDVKGFYGIKLLPQNPVGFSLTCA